MRYQVRSTYEWLYSDSVIDTASEVLKVLHAPLGGYAACQILVDGANPGDAITASCELSLCEDSLIRPEIYQLLDVPVEKNTGVHGFTVPLGTDAPYATRPAPFRVYDAMKPLKDCTARAATEAFYVCFAVSTDALPGNYSATVRLKIGLQTAEILLNIEIHNVLLPAETLKVTNWFNISNMATQHGLAPWSEEHWDMIEQYGRAMRRARQNVFWVTWDTLQISTDDSGDYTFDFSRVERLISTYLGLGFTVIEGAMLLARTSWDSNEFFVSAVPSHPDALSPEGYRFLTQFLHAWHDFLFEHGWLDRLIQHVGDEPHPGCADTYRIASGIIRHGLPGVPLIDAVESAKFAGSLDIWVPKCDFYSRHRDDFEAYRNLGDRLWFYTCCIPGGYYANRLLDMPLLRTRLLHWGNYRFGLEGYLHWGLNFSSSEPFNRSVVPNDAIHELPAGDTHIVYPGTSGPWLSLRLEQMRAGCEDYELLQMLAQKDATAADNLAQRCIPAFDQCDPAPEEFSAAYLELLRALEQ